MGVATPKCHRRRRRFRRGIILDGFRRGVTAIRGKTGYRAGRELRWQSYTLLYAKSNFG